MLVNLGRLVPKILLHPYAFLGLWVLSFAVPYFWIEQDWWFVSVLGQAGLISLALCCKSWRFLGVGLAILVVIFELPFFGGHFTADTCPNPTELIGTLAKDVGTDEHTLRKNLIQVNGHCSAGSFQARKIRVEVLSTAKVAKVLKWVRVGQQVRFSHPIFEQGILVDAQEVNNYSQLQRLLNRSESWVKVQAKSWYYLEPKPMQLFQAILLADRQSLHPDLRQKMQTLGIFHLFAISGLHVGMLYGIGFLILRWLLNLPRLYRINWGCPLWTVNLICWSLIGLYLQWIGYPVTAVRAFWMLGFWLLTRHVLPAAPSMLWLLIVAAGMLVFEPSAIGQVGFQLSFLSVSAILLSLPLLPKRHNQAGFLPNLGFGLLQLCFISLSILVWTLPLNLYYFGYVNGLSVVNNLMHIPWVGFLYLPSGLLAIGSSLIFGSMQWHLLEALAYTWLNWVSQWWLELVVWNSAWAAQASFTHSGWAWWYWPYFGVLCSLWLLGWLKRRKEG